MLAGDSKSAIDRRLFDDPRVTTFWDPRRLSGDWLAEHWTGRLGSGPDRVGRVLRVPPVGALESRAVGADCGREPDHREHGRARGQLRPAPEVRGPPRIGRGGPQKWS